MSSDKFDAQLYAREKSSDYLDYVDNNEEESDEEFKDTKRKSINAPKELLQADREEDNGDSMTEYSQRYGSGLVNTSIAARESEVSNLLFFPVIIFDPLL